MSIHYRVTQIANPLDLDAPKKFYLKEKSLGHIDREYLIKDMVRNTSLTKQEAATGIDYLFEALPRFLELGFTVQLGRIGYFMVTMKSEGSETAEEATVDKLKSMHLRFIPGTDIREEINGFSIEKWTL